MLSLIPLFVLASFLLSPASDFLSLLAILIELPTLSKAGATLDCGLDSAPPSHACSPLSAERASPYSMPLLEVLATSFTPCVLCCLNFLTSCVTYSILIMFLFICHLLSLSSQFTVSLFTATSIASTEVDECCGKCGHLFRPSH